MAVVTDLAIAGGTVGGTVLTMYVSVVRPRALEHKAREKDEAGKKKAQDAILDGIPAVPGMTEAVPPLAVRMQAVELTMSDVVKGQSLLEKRMNEANGTGRRTEATVIEIANTVNALVLAGNVTKSDLHDAASAVAGIATDRQRDILEAIADGVTHLPEPT